MCGGGGERGGKNKAYFYPRVFSGVSKGSVGNKVVTGGYLCILMPFWCLLAPVILFNWVLLFLIGASLIAQLVKNLPAIQDTPVRFLGQKDPLEKGEAIHSSILGLPLWLSW